MIESRVSTFRDLSKQPIGLLLSDIIWVYNEIWVVIKEGKKKEKRENSKPWKTFPI